MRTTFALLLTLALSPLAAAQSFDCKLAQSPREHAVCASRKLAALDKVLTSAYKSLRAQLSPESAALVQSDQREWLNWIDLVCPEHGKGAAADMYRCLDEGYANRVRDLKQVNRIGDAVFFTRAHFVYKAGATTYEPVSDIDPGFGSGSVRWPQIDLKDPTKPDHSALAAWNDLAKARALQLAARGIPFDDSISPGGTTDATYNLAAANDRIVEIEFIDSVYGYGAAQPNTSYTSFLWWLERNRELTVSDIFVLDSGWQQKLADFAVINLSSQPSLQNSLDENALNQWLFAGPDRFLNAPRNWILSRGALTITFAQSAIGPYTLGMPQARVRWEDLKPFLAKDLNPSTLPIRLPTPTR
jgi:uncharacterized protein